MPNTSISQYIHRNHAYVVPIMVCNDNLNAWLYRPKTQYQYPNILACTVCDDSSFKKM